MVQASIVNSAIPQGIILVYDITDEKSFENIQNWMKSIKEVRTVPERWGNWVEPRGWRRLWKWAGPSFYSYLCSQNASAGVERLLLGNKCDMEAKRKVQKEQADKVRAGWAGFQNWARRAKIRPDCRGLGHCPLSNSLLTTSSHAVGSGAWNPIFRDKC